MRSYEAQATIKASPDKVWAVLVDGAQYADWDSGVVSVEGTIALGETIKVVSSANPDRTFPVKVTEFQPGRSMIWKGGMPLGLFKGVRTFTLSETEDGSTRFEVLEVYSGLLLSMMWKKMPDLGPSFDQFARGLKKRVERQA